MCNSGERQVLIHGYSALPLTRAREGGNCGYKRCDNLRFEMRSVIDWIAPRSSISMYGADASQPDKHHRLSPMSELNSQITRLKITYLAKLPLFISLKSLCRYSSKAVSLLMRRTQEMGNRRTTHNVVHIKASDLLSRVPRFPLHSFSQG